MQHLYIALGGGWSQDAVAQNLSSTEIFLSDGAKRDRNPWSGDIVVALRSALVSQNYDNLRSNRNALQETIILQDRNQSSPTYGYFPYTGSPLGDLLITYGSSCKVALFPVATRRLLTILCKRLERLWLRYLPLVRHYRVNRWLLASELHFTSSTTQQPP